MKVNKIVCPTDFSEPSYWGVKVANDLCLHFRAEMVLVHVISLEPVYPVSAFAPGAVSFSRTAELHDVANKSLLITIQEKLSPMVESRPVLKMGSPPEAIVKTADEESADVIVIATHGHTGWRRFVSGSVAEKVVRMAACPVLTVPKPSVDNE
jgi:nucleotide-binding universal stress UspA family protein